jgi:hypothetical protein
MRTIISPPTIEKILFTASFKDNPPAKEAYKSEIVYSHIYSYIHKDGSSDTYFDMAQKINTSEAKQWLGEANVLFDSSRESVTFLKASVYLPSGKEISTDTNWTIERAPYTGLVYSDLKLKNLSFKGLEDRSVARLAYRKTERPTEEAGFIYQNIDLTTTRPCKERIYVTQIEAGTPVIVKEKIKQILAGLESKHYTLKNGNNVYVYKYINPKPEEPELYSVPEFEYSDRVAFLSVSTWDEIAQWYYRKAKDKMVPDNYVKEKAIELTKDKPTDEEKIKALYDYVRNIRYVSISLDQQRMVPHNASTTLKNQYGDCKDKSTLLIALLKSIGIDSLICLVNTWSLVDNADPTPRVFNHAIVAIPTKEGTYSYLDPVSTTTPYGYTPPYLEHRNGLVIKENLGHFTLIPSDDPEKHAENTTAKIEIVELKNAKISIKTVANGSGDYEQLLNTVPAEKLKKDFTYMLTSRFGQIELESIDLEKRQDKEQLVIEAKMTLENALKKMGNLYTFKMSLLSNLERRFAPLIATKERKTNIEIKELIKASSDITIEVPQDLSVEHLPQTHNAKSRFGEYNSTVSRSGKYIRIQTSFLLNQKRIAAKDYNEFKEFIKKCIDNEGENILLKKM